MPMTETDRRLLLRMAEALRQASTGQPLVRYDALADTLSVHFGGAARPTVIDPVEGPDGEIRMARLDPETDEIVGIQIEDVVGRRLARDPAIAHLLAIAEVRPVPVAGPARTRR